MPPRKLLIADAPAYIREKYGITVTRQTVYNYIKRGLQTAKAGTHGTYTATTWVDSYMSRLGKPPASLGPAV